MNRQYRGRDYATDVLSFSYGNSTTCGATGLQKVPYALNESEAPYLGDVIICPDVACRQAMRYRLSPQREMRKLVVHGILHLLGYDHESDAGAMNRLQTKLMRRRALAKAEPVVEIRD